MGLMSWLRGGRSVGEDTVARPRDAVPEPGDRGHQGDRGDRVDVRRLAPMQRTVAEQDLVINPNGFQGALSTRQTTALSTPLGHLVSPDAPTGVLHGITSAAPAGPVPSAQRSVEMPSRRTSGGRGAPVGSGGSAAAMPAALAAGGPASAASASAASGSAAPASLSVPEAVPVQRASSAMTSTGTSAVPDLSVRQLVGEQPLLPVSAPPQEVVEPAPEPRPGPEPPTHRTPGLGAPLAGLPPTAQRRAAASVPGSGRPEASSSPVRPEVAAAPDEPGAPSAVAEEPVAPLLGDDPLVGAVSGPGNEGEGEGEGEGAAWPLDVPVQRSVVGAGPPPPSLPAPPAPPPSPRTVASQTVPLLGDRPLTPRTAVQRDARSEGEARHTVAPAVPGLAPPPVPVRWTTSAPGSSSPPSRSASVSVPGSVPVQRSAVVARGPAPPVPGSLSRTDRGAGIPTAGAFAVAAGVAQRMPDGSVVFGSSSAGTSGPVVQRDAELSEEPPPPDPAPDLAPDSEPVSEPTNEDGSPPPGASAAAGAGATPGRSGAPVVTDELVRALYAPLSRLLKADLRLDRERAGFLINTRH